MLRSTEPKSWVEDCPGKETITTEKETLRRERIEPYEVLNRTEPQGRRAA